MKTEITELLGIEYPIIQGGMAWVAEYHLAAAVSEAGGLGLIGAASAPAEWGTRADTAGKKLTDKPFGANLMLLNPNADEVAKVIVEEGVKVVTTGAGNPEKYMPMWKEAGVKVIPVVAFVALAKRMERRGADVVVRRNRIRWTYRRDNNDGTCTTGCGCSKYSGYRSRRYRRRKRNRSSIYAGGAKAVQMGTHFVVTDEAQVHENYKNRIIKAKDIDTKVTGRKNGHPVRALRNQMTKEYLDKEAAGASFEGAGASCTWRTLRRAVQDGDVDRGSLMSGQSAGLVKEKMSCAELIQKLVKETDALLKGTGLYE